MPSLFNIISKQNARVDYRRGVCPENVSGVNPVIIMMCLPKWLRCSCLPQILVPGVMD